MSTMDGTASGTAYGPGPAPGDGGGTDTGTGPAPSDQAPVLMAIMAGYVGHRTIAIGLRSGLLHTLSDRPGATAEELAGALDMDGFYVSVWCRSALAAGVLERVAGGYRLAPHMATLLLETGSPSYMGGTFLACEQPEMFTRFEESLGSGRRTWWDRTSPEWIAAVAATGAPFYARLIPDGLERVPGLAPRLAGGCRVVDTACGAGAGILRLAETYPACEIIGVDGDPHSVGRARSRVDEARLGGRVRVVCSPLEEMALEVRADVVVNNISMHECRDIDRVTQHVRAALEPGGWFVISDFPFPDTDEDLRTPPGRLMSGVQFFEAQIDDQLLPRRAYDSLLDRHGFTEIGSAQLAPVHAITYGRAA